MIHSLNIQYNTGEKKQISEIIIRSNAKNSPDSPKSKPMEDLVLPLIQDLELKPIHVLVEIADSSSVSPVSIGDSSDEETAEPVYYLIDESNESSSSTDRNVANAHVGANGEEVPHLYNPHLPISPSAVPLIYCNQERVGDVDQTETGESRRDQANRSRNHTPKSEQNRGLGGEVLDDDFESAQPQGHQKKHADDIAHQKKPILNSGSPNLTDCLDVQRVYVRSATAEVAHLSISPNQPPLRRTHTTRLGNFTKTETGDFRCDQANRSTSHAPKSEKNRRLGGEVLDDYLEPGQPQGYLKEHLHDIAHQQGSILNSGTPASADILNDASSLQEEKNNKEEPLPQTPTPTASPASPQRADPADSFPILEMEKSKDQCSCCVQ